MKKAMSVCAAVIGVAVLLVFASEPWKRLVIPLDQEPTFTERVEPVYLRTSSRHAECPSNGCWNAYGQPQRIEAYGIDKLMWPHRCDGCGRTNMIYDARWPQIKTEWRPVK